MSLRLDRRLSSNASTLSRLACRSIILVSNGNRTGATKHDRGLHYAGCGDGGFFARAPSQIRTCICVSLAARFRSVFFAFRAQSFLFLSHVSAMPDEFNESTWALSHCIVSLVVD